MSSKSSSCNRAEKGPVKDIMAGVTSRIDRNRAGGSAVQFNAPVAGKLVYQLHQYYNCKIYNHAPATQSLASLGLVGTTSRAALPNLSPSAPGPIESKPGAAKIQSPMIQTISLYPAAGGVAWPVRATIHPDVKTNCISSRIVRRLELVAHWDDVVKEFQANGLPLDPSVKYVDFDFLSGGSVCRHRFYVVERARFDLLIGKDLLSTAKVPAGTRNRGWESPRP